MKPNYIIVFFVFMASALNAQVEDIITALDPSPGRLFLDGDILYCSSLFGIYAVDISDEANPTYTLFQDQIGNPTGIARYGNDFYAAEFTQNRIVKFDMNDPNASIIEVTSTSQTPNTLQVYNDYLYYSDNNAGAIYRYDLNGNSNESELVVDNFIGVIGIAIEDDILYYSVPNLDNEGLYKIDLNDPSLTPVQLGSGFFHILGIKIYGDDLYIADRDFDVVYRIDVSQEPIEGDVFFFDGDISDPIDIEVVGNYLYILHSQKLSRVALASLSTLEYAPTNAVSLYPNPVVDVLYISNLKTDQTYEIIDLHGRLIKRGMIHNNDNGILLSELRSGYYLIRLKEIEQTFKFLKK